MIQGSICVVIGAKGATSKQLLLKLMQKGAAEIRAVIRPTSQALDVDSKTQLEEHHGVKFDATVKIFQADLSKPTSLKEALEGATYVFNAAAGKGYQACVETDWFGTGIVIPSIDPLVND